MSIAIQPDERNVAIPMRDGTILRAHIYYPEGDGPFPVLVCRTPYGKPYPFERYEGKRMVERGYAVVIQDCRGAFRSDGEFYPFLHDGADGYDTIEWIADQQWCSGTIGMFGGSAMGATQWLCAVEAPPHLTTIAPLVTASDYHNGFIYQSGAFLMGFAVSWAIGLARSSLDKLGVESSVKDRLRSSLDAAVENRESLWRNLPLKSLPILQHPGLALYFFDWLTHPDEDDYWKRWKIEDYYDRVKIPVLNLGGWYDIFLGGTLRNFRGMREKGGGKKARDAASLVVGPWYHGPAPETPPPGRLDVGPTQAAGNLDINGLCLDWFDHWLKGEPNGVNERPRVKIYTMGAHRWQEFDDWPPEDVTPVDFYLHSHGRANTKDGDGSLNEKPPGNETPDRFTFDPDDPVPTVGGQLCCPPMMTPGGAFDQRTVEERQDVLVYTSDPLESDLEVTGQPIVKLWAATSARDTDFAAKLVDVRPDGLAINLTDNLVRTRYRESLAMPELLEPDREYEYAIDLLGMSNVFKAGHCIRLEISSSNFPRFDRNPNTGRNIAAEHQTMIAHQTIFHDSVRPSKIILPVRPG